ncbi:NAD-dependent epimerase/dehydratase family protein [Rhodanobacter sp. AS-Z3]|uniref:NAD-dependent epimerase/dehydratase family protein n=1 Tax=Rhodanobacter sp. AS-Z3 TaxID=3031330 RepID=UPI00247B0EC8|nr:NAD-dependent epimerase/dehydratase family protein [Rhodanobacter sp. AS-Z3]WEN16267.1 NAD-dependent epimerase/dehydratase family protein [Rhodanobacter sp. AS-Z3]
MSERILLAGCGDLGMRVAQRLLARGDEVWALRRQPPARDGSGIHWLRGDLTEPSSFGKLPTGMTRLVYLPAPDVRDKATYRALFVGGLRHLLEALDGRTLRRVLFVSSSAVYGEHDGDWVDESSPTAPRGFNGSVLREAEQWLSEQPLESIVLRLAGLYGPGRLQLVERLRAGQVRVPREAPHWSNRVHIDDAAAAIAHLLHVAKPQPLYLGVDDTPMPLDELYDFLAALIDVPAPAEGAPPVGVGSKRLSNARLRASGWTPHWPDAREGYAALLDN